MRSPLGSEKGNPRRGPCSSRLAAPSLARRRDESSDIKSRHNSKRKNEVAAPLSSRKKTADHDSWPNEKGATQSSDWVPSSSTTTVVAPHCMKTRVSQETFTVPSGLIPRNARRTNDQGRPNNKTEGSLTRQGAWQRRRCRGTLANRAPGQEVQAASPFEHHSLFDH